MESIVHRTFLCRERPPNTAVSRDFGDFDTSFSFSFRATTPWHSDNRQ